MDRKSKCVLFRWMRPHHFLILMAVTTLLSFILGYAISVSLKHVHYLFPYISDTGTTPPASSYFGLCLNLASIFSIISMYFRHGYLEKQNCLSTVRLHTLNDVAFLLGGLSSFGIMMVANFQETSVLALHLIGAMLTFILGILYCWVHTYLSYKVVPKGFSTKTMVYVRGVLSAIATLGFLLTVIGANIASQESKKTINLHWTSEQKVRLNITFIAVVLKVDFFVHDTFFYFHFLKRCEGN